MERNIQLLQSKRGGKVAEIFEGLTQFTLVLSTSVGDTILHLLQNKDTRLETALPLQNIPLGTQPSPSPLTPSFTPGKMPW